MEPHEIFFSLNNGENTYKILSGISQSIQTGDFLDLIGDLLQVA